MNTLQGIDITRQKVRERDNHTCQKCKKKWRKGRRFDVHHLDLKMESKRNYNYDKNNIDKLITICHKCHLNMPHIKKKLSLSYNKEKRSFLCLIKNKNLIDKSIALYKDGFSLREIGKTIGRSHEWVRTNIEKKLSTDKRIDNT
mgnify:CR=1 FL=1